MRTEDCRPSDESTRESENVISALSAAAQDRRRAQNMGQNRLVAGASVEKARPEVPSACENLHHNVESLVNKVELLRQRLEPLCQSSMPDAPADPLSQGAEAPLATYIWGEASKVSDVIMVLDSLLHRLQI
jgi:hypothetical protein